MHPNTGIEITLPRVTVKRDQPRVRTNYPTIAILPGLALIVAGVIMNALAWRSAHGGAPRPITVFVLFGFSFIMCGLLLSGYTIKGMRLRQRLKNVGGHVPWRFDNLWDLKGADDSGIQRVRNNFFAIIGISFFLVPFHLILPEISDTGFRQFFILTLGIFDLGILLAACRTFYLLLRRLIFGSNRVLFQQFPYYTGQILRLTFSGSSRLSNRQGLQAVLHCIKEYHESHGSGKNRTITPIMESIWRKDCSFNTNSFGFADLAFDLPLDVPGTDLIGDPNSNRQPHYWELEITAEQPGIDYEGIFLIPVYNSAEPTDLRENRSDQLIRDNDKGEQFIRSGKIGSVVMSLFFSFFLIAGCFVVMQTTKRMTRNYNLVHYGMKGKGTVIDYKHSSGTPGTPGSIWPVVKFITSKGTSVTFESLHHPNYSGYSMGARVPIVYDTKDPQIAEIDQPERLWGGIMRAYILGCLFMIIGGGAIIFLLKRGWTKSNEPTGTYRP